MLEQHSIQSAQSAQKVTQVIDNRFCTACQLGVHCGDCACCSGHHVQYSSTRIILSTGDMVRVPLDADPDSYRRFCEAKLRLAANPKRKKQIVRSSARSKRVNYAARVLASSSPFDAGVQATALRMDELATMDDEDCIFVNGIAWDIPFMGEPVVYEDERDSRFEYAVGEGW